MSDWFLSRRQALQLMGVGAVGAVLPIACSRSDQAESAGAEIHGAYPYDKPPKGHFNYLAGVAGFVDIGFWQDLMLLPGAMYLWKERTYYYLLAEDSSTISPDGKTLVYTVRKGLKWSDDKDVTGDDVYATWRCLQAMGHAAFDYIDDFELTDKQTVTFHIAEPAPIVEYYLLRARILSAAAYGEFAAEADTLFKGGKDGDATKLSGKLSEFKPESVVANGPFNIEVDTISNSELYMKKNDGGFMADEIKFQQVTIYNGRGEDIAPIVQNKQIDYATHGFPVAAERTFVKAGLEILRPPVYSGPAIYFNQDKHPEFRDKRVRQAFAHIIDRDQNGRVVQAESGKGVQMMAGMSDLHVPEWLSTEDQEKLNRYEVDLDKAADLLTQAGWKKDGDTWTTSEGKSAKYDMIFVAEYPDWTASAQNAINQLNEFGFDITSIGQQVTIETDNIDSGKFSLGVQGWGSSSNPFPADSFRLAFFNHNIPELKAEGKRGMGFPLQQTTDVLGDIDIEKEVVAAGLGATEDDLKAHVTRIALAFNELLPTLPLYERYGNNPIIPDGPRVKGWPEPNDPILRNSPYADNFTTLLMFQGRLTPA